MVHFYNPCTQEGEEGESGVQGQPGLPIKTLPQTNKKRERIFLRTFIYLY
jgi:hypothetical protein